MTHIFDRAAGAGLALAPTGSAVFSGGWGDRWSVELLSTPMTPASIEPADIVWEPKTEHRGLRRRHGNFTSPTADLLPPSAQAVPIELIEPAAGSKRIVVLMPSWNDEGFDRRREIARLLVERRIASCYFDVPFYGARRVDPGRRLAIATVGEFALMGTGAVADAHAVLGALTPMFGGLGVGGFSMGGNLAALVSATTPLRLATGVMAASHSPGPVYLDGVLRRAIAWGALGGRTAEPELRSLLGAVTTTTTHPLPHHRAAIAVAGRGDGFVPPSAAAALVEHWPGCEARWLAGGHATLWWRHKTELADAIADSFDRLA